MPPGDPALARCSRHVGPRWQTQFGRWMKKKGVPNIVKELGNDPDTRITPDLPYQWLNGITPRPHRAMALVAISDGELTLDTIYSHPSELAVLRVKTTTDADSISRHQP